MEVEPVTRGLGADLGVSGHDFALQTVLQLGPLQGLHLLIFMVLL